ncbi:ankyrin repeat domain-containing protein [Leptospira noguchii]|uniref:Ankyrin repeat protein n=2 Tax=Leptospira noguchii TaxID=28182 RepID=M6UML8_9LEPT|nr:ankyrin repeat domain-containing protein [Leptospira noguchii]EMO28735.1 ankyrin repeat protein [Leptospira interrogans serovar Bataviae str. HAI135]EMO42304.1 ankyrin repeat protein [Leptospira noguchii serovar Autumnalis str. ZUN142]EMO52526.1 ankyrin repeat protein [Leptospira noguchii]UOG50700.1 ankyrin repeat domain-containing protein [Leptospira noguchii]UOG62436.1 ankyrin repeat domain-containing protein [Leptospira noguchii]
MSEMLTQAILKGDILEIRKFLETGNSFENVQVVDPKGFGRSPLQFAAIAEADYGGSSEVTKIIFENSSEPKQAEALFFFASEDNYLAYTKVLLKAGIQPDVSEQNQTPLQLAVGNHNLKTTYWLLAYGADSQKKGKYGSAIEIANSGSVYEEILKSAIEGKVKSPYYFLDLERIKEILRSWTNSIQLFSAQHNDQKFYVFGIDVGRLVANTEEAFQKTLQYYVKNYGDQYKSQEKIQHLRYSSGDFSFSIPIVKTANTDVEVVGLDFSFLEPQKDEDRTEKELLRDGLVFNRDFIFKHTKVSDDFKIFAFGHIY